MLDQIPNVTDKILVKIHKKEKEKISMKGGIIWQALRGGKNSVV
jgi:hypothetical protein